MRRIWTIVRHDGPDHLGTVVTKENREATGERTFLRSQLQRHDAAAAAAPSSRNRPPVSPLMRGCEQHVLLPPLPAAARHVSRRIPKTKESPQAMAMLGPPSGGRRTAQLGEKLANTPPVRSLSLISHTRAGEILFETFNVKGCYIAVQVQGHRYISPLAPPPSARVWLLSPPRRRRRRRHRPCWLRRGSGCSCTHSSPLHTRLSWRSGPRSSDSRTTSRQVRGPPTNMDYNPTRWPESPRIVMRCATRASNGRDHPGF